LTPEGATFKTSGRFTYFPAREMIQCNLTPRDRTKFDDWCDAHGMRYTAWLGKPDEVFGVTAELFVLFKMTWD
jgi:hypothetical protein